MEDFNRLREMSQRLTELKAELRQCYRIKGQIFDQIDAIENEIRQTRNGIRMMLDDKWRQADEIVKAHDAQNL